MGLFENKKILVTGGAGFIGSHLTERLLSEGGVVTVVDNFVTGNRKNVEQLQNNKNFKLIEADVSEPVENYLKDEVFEFIFHLASPASPRGYLDKPIETYKVNSFGTHYLAEYAHKTKARIVYASTSESYGDPLEHPQKESYWGNVNPVGVRSCYDESKRFGEMVLTTWRREKDLDIRIVRIFNTYGPRMDPKDGRVIPNFITQALANKPITVYGDGSQTRSFCYVLDLVEYFIRTMLSDKARGEVINIGNPDEYTMLDFALTIKELINSSSEIVYEDLPSDDPTRRKPDISKAVEILDYSPKVDLKTGLAQTIAYFKGI